MNIGTLVAKAVIDVKGYESGLEKLGATNQKQGKKIAAGLATASAAVTVIGADIVATAVQFDDSMRRVKAITGSTGDEFNMLSDKARELGASSVFSASEAASAMEFLGMAGFETNEIMDATPGVMNLAAAGAMDLGSAADIASNMISQFGLEAADAGSVSDMLAAAASSSNQSVTELSEAMKYLGPTAQSLGVDLAEATAITAKLADTGLKGGVATRSLSSAFTRLASPTAAMQKTMDDLNVSFFDSNGEFVGMNESIRRVSDSTQDLTQEQKAAAISSLFGAESYKSVNALMNVGADELDAYTDSMRNSGGAASDMAATMTEGPGGTFKQLNSALEELQLTIAESGVVEFIAEIAKGITDFVRHLSETNPDLLKFGVALAGILAVAGPILGVFSTISAVVGGLAVALSMPALLIAAIIAAVGLLVYTILTRWEDIKAGAARIFNQVKATIEGIFAGIGDIFNGIITGVQTAMTNIGEGIRNFFGGIRDAVMGLIRPVIDMINSAIEASNNVLGTDFDTIATGTKQRAPAGNITTINQYNNIASAGAGAKLGMATAKFAK